MDKIFTLMKSKFGDNYIELIAKEYTEIKKAAFVKDAEIVGLHTGRICELISSLLCHYELNLNEDLNKISFNKNYKNLINSMKPTPEKELLLLTIPRMLRALYTLRSKKKIVHIKKFKPELIDIKVCINLVDWVLAQILISKFNLENDVIVNFLKNIVEIDFPFYEKFENGDIMFKNNLNLNEKILIVLYQSYNNKRLSKEDLYTLIKPKQRSYISTYLNNLLRKKFIHISEKGSKLTRWGLEEVQKIINKFK